MEAREKRCSDLPAQGLLNSLGAVVVRGGGRRLGEQGGLGLGFLLPGSSLKSRNHDLHVSNLVGRDQGCQVVEKQEEAISGISLENVFFLHLVALNFLFYLYLVIDKS